MTNRNVVLLILYLLTRESFGASAVGHAVQEVLVALSINSISDLNFGQGVQGDSPKTIAPGTIENSENASFQITGEPGKAYVIQLPQSDIKMITGTGNTPQTQISVTNFQVNPSLGGFLSPSGSQMLFVGATRAALLPNQARGLYSGAFTVIVTY